MQLQSRDRPTTYQFYLAVCLVVESLRQDRRPLRTEALRGCAWQGSPAFQQPRSRTSDKHRPKRSTTGRARIATRCWLVRSRGSDNDQWAADPVRSHGERPTASQAGGAEEVAAKTGYRPKSQLRRGSVNLLIMIIIPSRLRSDDEVLTWHACACTQAPAVGVPACPQAGTRLGA